MKSNKNKSNIILVSTVIIILLFLLIFGISKQLSLIKRTNLESRIATIEDFNKDRKNDKALAWLKVSGTNIDYPIIKGADEEVYEDGDIQYLWIEGELNKLNRMMYISGHNILNLSSNPIITDESHKRFEQLMSFTYYDFAKENQTVQLTINNKDYMFQIFSVSYINSSEISTYNFENDGDEAVASTLELSNENTIYKYDIDVDKSDTVISLVTCTRMFGYYGPRVFRVDARLLRDGEKVELHKVTKTANYEKVDKQMRGVNNNEKASA